MNMPIKTSPFALIPDDAPFSVEQRSWLSGFLASIVVPNAHKAVSYTHLDVYKRQSE